MGYHDFHDIVSKYSIPFTFFLPTLKKILFHNLEHISDISSTCPHHDISPFFSLLLNTMRSKILTQVLFNFFYIGFMHLSKNNIGIIIKTMMSTNIAIAFVTLTKTLVMITKI